MREAAERHKMQQYRVSMSQYSASNDGTFGLVGVPTVGVPTELCGGVLQA